MREVRRNAGRLLATGITVTLAACGGGGDGPTAPPSNPPSSENSASAEISGSGQSQALSYSSARNTVFCTRNAGWASLWVRLARDTAANGDNGPHIDLDLCNHTGGGTFVAQPAELASCGAEKTFDVYWHPGDGTTFANQPASGGCMLQLTQAGSRLTGTFACRGLGERGGSRTVDVLNGSFACTES